MRDDIRCPYCDSGQKINHNNDYGCKENVLYKQQCPKCKKNFAYFTTITFNYEANQANCLNGGPHKYKSTHIYPQKYTTMRCVACGEECKPTEKEMEKIIKEQNHKGGVALAFICGGINRPPFVEDGNCSCGGKLKPYFEEIWKITGMSLQKRINQLKTKMKNKFIIINKKYLSDLLRKGSTDTSTHVEIDAAKAVLTFLGALKDLEYLLPPNEYYVCDQTEPYAQKVIDIILEDEAKKETLEESK